MKTPPTKPHPFAEHDCTCCNLPVMSTISITSCVRGYHIYKDRWIPTLDKELTCQRECGNTEDPYAVAVLKDDVVVGHIPRKISTMCSMFLRRRGTIMCTVTGHKRYSADLVQGGMEVPCTLTFFGDDEVKKIRKLLPTDIPVILEGMYSSKSSYESPTKKLKADTSANLPINNVPTSASNEECVWVRIGNYSLLVSDKNCLTQGNNLSDKHINFGQQLIKEHHPAIGGLKCTLTITKCNYHYPDAERHDHFLQVIHSKGNHWITASNIGGAKNEVTVYDSLYNTIDKCTHDLLKHLLKQVNIKVFVI